MRMGDKLGQSWERERDGKGPVVETKCAWGGAFVRKKSVWPGEGGYANQKGYEYVSFTTPMYELRRPCTLCTGVGLSLDVILQKGVGRPPALMRS